MVSTIRYTNRSFIPSKKHYIVSKFPLGSSVARDEPIKYQTVVRLDGHKWDKQLQRWKREQRFVTVSHQQRAKRKEIEEIAKSVCQRTSEDFRIKKAVLEEGRMSPVYV